MTRRVVQIVLWWWLATAAWPSGSVLSETRFGGAAGFDLAAYGFTGSNHDTTFEYSARRSISNHFVDAHLAGNIVNQSFASFFLRGRLLGTFSQSSAGEATNNFYISPDLNAYYGNITLFPERRFPIRVFRGHQLLRSLEYEQQNRGETESPRPSLNVIRRYRRETTQTGGLLKFQFADGGSVTASTDKLETSSLREYDFSEDRDIWVDIIYLPRDPLADRHTLEITNGLPDADARVIVNGVDTTVAPSDYVRIVVDSGFQRVVIVPLQKYNQYDFTIRVEGEQIWKILYREPPSPRDQNAEETGQRVQFGLGENTRKSLTAYFDRSDRYDPFTNQTTKRDMANNFIDYSLDRANRLRLETSYSLNESYLGDRLGQKTRVISHETSFDHIPNYGLLASVMHEYSRTTTVFTGTQLVTNDNRFRSNLAMPFKTMDWRIELRSSVSLKNDNQNSATNQYDASLINQMTTRFLGFKWQPMNTSTYTVRDRRRTDGTTSRTNIVETVFGLIGSSIRSTEIGNVTLKGNLGYRKQTDHIGSDVKTTYGFDALVSRSLVSGLQLDVMTIQLWEDFGGSAPWDAAESPSAGNLSRPTEHKRTYRADLTMDPASDLSLGVNYSLVQERLSRIGQLGLNLVALVPVLNLPVTSNLTNSTRDIADLPTQKTLNLSTELVHQYRQIEFRLEHVYSREALVAQTFSYYEILGSITRRF